MKKIDTDDFKGNPRGTTSAHEAYEGIDGPIPIELDGWFTGSFFFVVVVQKRVDSDDGTRRFEWVDELAAAATSTMETAERAAMEFAEARPWLFGGPLRVVIKTEWHAATYRVRVASWWDGTTWHAPFHVDVGSLAHAERVSAMLREWSPKYWVTIDEIAPMPSATRPGSHEARPARRGPASTPAKTKAPRLGTPLARRALFPLAAERRAVLEEHEKQPEVVKKEVEK